MVDPPNFRAWDKNTHIMHYTDSTHMFEYFETGWHLIALDELGPRVVCGQVAGGRDDGVLMMGTTLSDRGGTDIYDGDIVNVGKIMGKAEIMWGSVGFVFHFLEDNFVYPGAMNHSLDTANERVLEVIGNIYEHPELRRAAS